MSGPRSLEQWLAWQEALHPKEIDLGLDRIRAVASGLNLGRPGHNVITVAGTNGKGSCIAILESILRAAGYRVGVYSSPHLLRYNERLRIDGIEAEDVSWCRAFERIESTRGDVPLTYYEYGTLAALQLLAEQQPDFALLEVGLGGRLDAVNLVDADCAIVTSIGIDHVEWLGADREAIGREKAGVFRKEAPAVCGDPDPPNSIREHAARIGARLSTREVDFFCTRGASSWGWKGRTRHWDDLPEPSLEGAWQIDNAAAALAALEALNWPAERAAIASGLRQVTLPGRLQRIGEQPPIYLDVAHNVDAARELAGWLAVNKNNRPWHAIVGMLDDKDVEGIAEIMGGVVDRWYTIRLESKRALDSEQLAQRIANGCEDAVVHACSGFVAALSCAEENVGKNGQLIVFGSFFTVAAALEAVQRQ